MVYRKLFIVKVILSPGTGYEDTQPSVRLMRNAIARAIEKELSPSGFIAAKVKSIKQATGK